VSFELLKLLEFDLLDLTLLLALLVFVLLFFLILLFLLVLEILALLPPLRPVEIGLLPVLAVPEVLPGSELAENGDQVSDCEVTQGGVGFQSDFGSVASRNERLLVGLPGLFLFNHLPASFFEMGTANFQLMAAAASCRLRATEPRSKSARAALIGCPVCR